MTRQSEFREGLLNPDAPVPPGLLDGQGRPSARRYAVYRNNVTVSLREALSEGFPSIVKLIGQENFDHVARGFLRQSPPDSALMMHYGAGFPDYIEQVEQLSKFLYLADVARIDLMLRQSYHAPDAAPIDPAALQSMDEATLLATRFEFAPSLALIRSKWPAGSIWRFAMRPGAPKPPSTTEDIVILRAEFDPEPHVLGSGAAEVLTALVDGEPFGNAVAKGGTDFDLAALLGLLISNNAITRLT